MKRICVFCGSSSGEGVGYIQAARRLGTILAQHKLGLVYGGGKVGMMGHLAKAVLDAGGEVIGVIPRCLMEKNIALTTISELRVVDSMHERKMAMEKLGDAFLALPGGIGTLDEFFEMWTWGQLGLHRKPCGLLNICGYYTSLLGFLERMVEQRFIDAAHRNMLLVEEDPERMLMRMAAYQAPMADKTSWALGMEAI